MELFEKDSQFQDYKKYKQAREDFTEANNEMTDSIDLKTVDPKEINYAEVHTSIYQEVGLRKEWRVDKSKNYEEIEKATDGFLAVTNGLEPYPDRSIQSKSLIQIILSFFKK